MLRGSRAPEPLETVLAPGPVTFSVPLRSGPVNVTVTVVRWVLAVLPLPGELDLYSTWANAVAAVTALTATAAANAREKRFMGMFLPYEWTQLGSTASPEGGGRIASALASSRPAGRTTS